MGEAGFEGVRKYITRRQNIVAQYIATQPILDLCERSARQPGVRVSWWWWEQAGIYLEGKEERAAEAATDLESDSESGGEERSRMERVCQVERSGVEQKSECP